MTSPMAKAPDTQTILVTGAGGFVGAQMAQDLSGLGFDVVVTDQAFDHATLARLSHLRRVEAPLALAMQQLSDLAPLCVVHAAAITAGPTEAGLTPAAHVRTNVELLTQCLDWARTQGAARFVFLSSTGVFTATDASDRLTELTPATGHEPYAAAKRAGEIITQGAAEPGFATLSLRLGNLFGPHEVPRPTRPSVSLLTRMVREARAGTIRVTNPAARREWTWAPDLGRALAALLQGFPSTQTPVLHCGNTDAWTDLALAQAIAGLLPGTRIEVKANPVPTKPPMGSAVRSALSDFAWTPLQRALAALLSERSAA